MVVQVKDESPVTINIPEVTCTIEDSGNENSISVLENPEIVSLKQHNAAVADKIPEASKAAAKKKPGKILPCPHCNKMETKFFYLSNYNVSQTRNFCSNCQRYQTPGGSIKNHPLRAIGCKSKYESSYHQPVTKSSDELGLEEPRKLLEVSSVACRERIRVPSTMRKNEVPNTLQGFPGPPYPWNTGLNGESLLVPFNSSTMEMIPGINSPSVPFTWSNRLSPLNSAGNSDSFGSTSPSSTKHSRDLKSQDEKKNEKCLCLPKSLRIVIDPDEAAKSSIWRTLGIKSGKTDPFRNGCMFEAFQFRPGANAEKSEVDKALEANPVAHSRSQRFHESST